MKKRDITAMSLAQVILGACGRVVSARLDGADANGALGGAGEVRLTAEPGAAVSLDMTFMPRAEALPLGLRWRAPEVPVSLRDVVKIAIDGRDVGVASPGQPADGPAIAMPVATPENGLSLDMLALLGLSPGQQTRLTIELAGQPEATPELLIFSEAAAKKSDNYIAVDDATTITRVGATTLALTANDIGPGNSGIYITAINGVALEPGESVTLSGGQVITLLDDGTVSIVSNGEFDSFSFEYTAAYGKGNARQIDSANVTVDTVPCFVAGTLIRTAGGDVPVERLSVGDLVRTRDDGLQPIRWIGRRRVAALGPFAPVAIAADTFGAHDALMVSPLHRVLVRNAAAELCFGTHEVLAHARDLLRHPGVSVRDGGQVEYVHLLFDRHQILWSGGLETESFLPGPQTKHLFEAPMVAEIAALFPQLDPATGAGYGPTARPALRSREARLLVA